MSELETNIAACTEANEAELPALLAAQSGILNEIGSVKANTQSIMDQIQSTRLQAQPNLLAKNQNIPCEELFELNQQAVHEVWIEQLTQAPVLLTSPQIATLTDIAHQCPRLGGSAVYAARAMLSAIQSDGPYLDDCPDGGSAGQQPSNMSKTGFLYPNPASDQLTIQLEDWPACNRLELSDALGKSIMNIQLTPETKTLNIDISNIPNGIYVISCFNKNKLVVSEKLVKQ
jgi:hypothetical protein